MGKTALATNLAYNVARAWQGETRADGHMHTINGGIVGFFSLEMSAEQLATRIIAEQTGVPSSTIRRGGINELDFEMPQSLVHLREVFGSNEIAAERLTDVFVG
jgi:replicative DNA helicase